MESKKRIAEKKQLYNGSHRSIRNILQIIEIKDYCKFPNVATFDRYGKKACLNYFDRLLRILRKDGIIYHAEFNNPNNVYTYIESYLKVKDNQLIKVNSFYDCEFYERSFFTVDSEGNDLGFVSSINYTILNGGNSID